MKYVVVFSEKQEKRKDEEKVELGVKLKEKGENGESTKEDNDQNHIGGGTYHNH